MQLYPVRPRLTEITLNILKEVSKTTSASIPTLLEIAVSKPDAWSKMLNTATEKPADAKPVSATGKKALLKVAHDYVDRWTFDPTLPSSPSIEASQAKLDAYDRDEPREGYDEYAAARAALGLPNDPYDEMIESWRADIEQHIAFITHRKTI